MDETDGRECGRKCWRSFQKRRGEARGGEVEEGRKKEKEEKKRREKKDPHKKKKGIDGREDENQSHFFER